jgi:DnaJ-class molecular chaperone
MERETVGCPDCGGFGYHEDGTDEGRECETCHGDGTIPKPKETK